MIDSATLLKDLRRLLGKVEADIREHLGEQPALDAELKSEWQAARDAKRTAATYFGWRDEAITQAAAHWILACVFLRFLEDNGFLDRSFLFGRDAAAQTLARDRHETYFRANPIHTDREYLIACFNEAATLPGLAGLYDLPVDECCHGLPSDTCRRPLERARALSLGNRLAAPPNACSRSCARSYGSTGHPPPNGPIHPNPCVR